MIRDLDETLRKVLQDPTFAQQFPELAGADIVFDRPADPFNPAKTTVNLFLYDVRENTELRDNDFDVVQVNGQTFTRPAALRLSCSYMATAWPVGGTELALQEHRLLTQVLRVLSRYPMIPDSFCVGSLKEQAPPLPMVALHPDALKNLAEFWSSLGSKLRASLTVTVTISVPVFADVPEFVVTTSTTRYAPGLAAPQESVIQVGGRVIDPMQQPPSQGIAGALVDIVDAGLRGTTDSNGDYSFAQVPAGAHTLRAIAAGYQPKTQPFVVPGRPEDYQITLTPL
ncbi:MAG TPA: Pvc16 family protein [Candidatus Solibacter sp.]|nr:Pvc16 family protein [Candidatus Solibacter sp.]